MGQVMVDVHLGADASERIILGGAMHATRALCALGVTQYLYFISPSYLDDHIARMAREYIITDCLKVGNVSGCPNLLLIQESTEAGPQGYMSPLEPYHATTSDLKDFEKSLNENGLTDIFIFAGGFDLSGVLQICGKFEIRVHIDASYGPKNMDEFGALRRAVTCIALSTSSDSFLNEFKSDPSGLATAYLEHSESVLFKENRGGARLFVSGQKPTRAAAQVRPVIHSVGVGDCYNVVFAVARQSHNDAIAMAMASMVAAEYAVTTNFKTFKASAEAVLSLAEETVRDLKGVSLPWERRKDINIYIAAPDFSRVDRRPLKKLEEALRYHNFTPRLPVQENGEAAPTETQTRKQALFEADVRLLDQCQIMVAVLLFHDPGTYVEMGMAAARKIPVIVYDPYSISSNLMVTQLPEAISHRLDDVIAEVFISAGKIDGARSEDS